MLCDLAEFAGGVTFKDKPLPTFIADSFCANSFIPADKMKNSNKAFLIFESYCFEQCKFEKLQSSLQNYDFII